SAGQKLELQLLGKIRALDNAEIPGKPSLFAPPPPDRAIERGRAQKQLRFQQTIDMITLTGFDKAGALEKQLQAAVNTGDDASWLKLAERLSEIWPRQLVADFKAGEQQMLRADRQGRVLSPFDLASVRSTEPGHWSQNPSLALHRRDLAAFWQWLSDRY